MTATDAPPAATAAQDVPAEPAAEPTGLHRLVTTTDHKLIGRMYVVVALVLAVIVTIVGVFVGIERIALDDDVIYQSLDQMVQSWQQATVGLVFMVVVPLFIGLATAVVPLQVGSPAIAFPRATAMAFWGWLLGAGICIVTFIPELTDGGLGTPNGVAESDPVALSVLGVAVMVISLALACVTIATTVIALRPRGMKLHHVPLFSWSMLIAASAWLLAFGVLLANLALVSFDLHGRDAVAFGEQASIWSQVAWVFTGPQALAWAIPLLGVVGDVVPVATGRRLKGYNTLLGAIAAFGILTFAAYAQPAFDLDGLAVTEQALYVGQAFALIVPVLVVLGGLLDALRVGARDVGVPQSWLVSAYFGLLVLLTAGVVGALRVIDGFSLVGTSADQAVFVLALSAGLLGGLAGLAFWSPKVLGHTLTNPFGYLAAFSIAFGAVLAGVAELIAGFLDQPAVPDTTGYVPDDGVEFMNLLVMIGVALIAVGVLLALVDMFLGMVTADDETPDDPWGGHTLEWATTSPPPPGNFLEPVGPIESERPLLDARAAAEAGDAGDTNGGEG